MARTCAEGVGYESTACIVCEAIGEPWISKEQSQTSHKAPNFSTGISIYCTLAENLWMIRYGISLGTACCNSQMQGQIRSIGLLGTRSIKEDIFKMTMSCWIIHSTIVTPSNDIFCTLAMGKCRLHLLPYDYGYLTCYLSMLCLVLAE